MMDAVSLVRVMPSDLDALKDYVVALYEHEEDFDSLVNVEAGVRSLLKHEHLATAYFVRDGAQRVGYTILTKYHSVEKGGLTMYIDELFIEPKFRKHGLGTAVIEKILEIAKENDVKWLWVQTEPVNEDSKRFFIKHGFSENRYKNFERPI